MSDEVGLVEGEPGDLMCSLVHSRRSFVPPSRDEESETQRKAHAKLVRSTRRSTQGVTLDEIRSAEQFVKNKQQVQNVSKKECKGDRKKSKGMVVY